MVRLITEDSPDVVCLQEVLLWSLGSIEEWTGIRSLQAVTTRSVRPSRDFRRQHRLCQLLPVEAEERLFVIANLHESNDESAEPDELNLAVAVVSDVELVIVYGDFNVPPAGFPEFIKLIAGIDQIVVRGLEVVAASNLWPIEQQCIGEHLWSDHAFIEVAVA